MGDLSVLPNIGPKIEAQLLEVGITTPAELIDVGSQEAWLRIKAIDDSACINRLYALEGAIQGISDRSLPSDVKSELKSFYNENK
ncbi:MAG: TfoX/Sxy family protein [Actinobacteria bacterium]|nr:TfoX/Sxy family protein [Actinomycetota bacterium]